MTLKWRVMLDAPRGAAGQMALDERLALEAQPVVRLFRWAPDAVSLGWKQPLPGWLDLPRWQAAGLEWVERPSGGGMGFHGSDVSIAVVVPRACGLALAGLMAAVCQSAARLSESYGISATALLEETPAARLTYCLTQRSPYAVLLGDRKVAGFALRRYPESWLIHGSLLVTPLPQRLVEALPADLVASLRGRAASLSERAEIREEEVLERWTAHWASWWEMQRAADLHRVS